MCYTHLECGTNVLDQNRIRLLIEKLKYSGISVFVICIDHLGLAGH